MLDACRMLVPTSTVGKTLRLSLDSISPMSTPSSSRSRANKVPALDDDKSKQDRDGFVNSQRPLLARLLKGLV
jgi:hypothetical protein